MLHDDPLPGAMRDIAAPHPGASGREVRIAGEGGEAVVCEVGATLRDYRSGGAGVLDGFAAGEMASAGRGQVLLPWPNRIARGRYRFGSQEHQLPIDEPELANAIHGFARWLAWRLEPDPSARDVPSALTAEAVLFPRPGYPWRLRARIRYDVTGPGLTCEVEVRNDSERAAPLGIGFHPYVSVGDERIDTALLEVPASTVLATDARGIPVASRAVASGDAFDFRTARPIGTACLDTCFTGLAGVDEPGGRARCVLATAGGDRRIEVWMEEPFRYVMCYTGDTLPDAARRRRSIALEPMTCAPDAFRSGDGLIELAPGETISGSWGIVADVDAH